MRDDLIPEEHDVVYEGLRRLTDKEMFDRTFRLRRAVQLNLTKQVLPKSEWTTYENVNHPNQHLVVKILRIILIFGDILRRPVMNEEKNSLTIHFSLIMGLNLCLVAARGKKLQKLKRTKK